MQHGSCTFTLCIPNPLLHHLCLPCPLAASSFCSSHTRLLVLLTCSEGNCPEPVPCMLEGCVSRCALWPGVNVVMVAADLLLGRTPFVSHFQGYVGLWSLLYCVWAFTNFYLNHTWVYFVRAPPAVSQPCTTYDSVCGVAANWSIGPFHLYSLELCGRLRAPPALHTADVQQCCTHAHMACLALTDSCS